MNQVSKKASKITNELKKTYSVMLDSLPPLCTGCGGSQNLTHSHILPRSRCHAIGRPELIHDIHNITYHCQTCHDKWSCNKRTELLDYEININYIFEVDKEYYYLLTQKQKNG